MYDSDSIEEIMETSDILARVAIFLSTAVGIFSLFLAAIAYKSNARLNDLDWITRTQKADILIFFTIRERTIYESSYDS